MLSIEDQNCFANWLKVQRAVGRRSRTLNERRSATHQRGSAAQLRIDHGLHPAEQRLEGSGGAPQTMSVICHQHSCPIEHIGSNSMCACGLVSRISGSSIHNLFTDICGSLRGGFRYGTAERRGRHLGIFTPVSKGANCCIKPR